MLNPQDRVIMVSGANRGIGRAIARCLHGKGYRLSLGIRDATAMQAAKDGFDAGRVMIHRHEARVRALNEAWGAATIDRFRRLDGLVNAAGVLLPVGIEEDDEARYNDLWAVNVMGPLR